MRELLVVLFVIGLVLALTALRYRKQIVAVYRFWTTLRSAKQRSVQPQMNEHAREEAGPLVNCAKCGVWVPESRAIRLGTRIFYCSAACMEKSATAM